MKNGVKMTNNIPIKRKIEESKFKKYAKKPIVVEAYQTDEEMHIETLEDTMKKIKEIEL